MKKWATPLFAAVLCAFSICIAVAGKAPPPLVAPVPAPRLQQAFNLGVADYAPTAAIFRLDETIKHSHLQSSQLAPIAEQTRSAERSAYHSAGAILKEMGAADYIVQPYIDAEHTLSMPIVITDAARQHVANDPVAQMVWSTLDEADQITPQGNGALAAWLKLSRGRNALWAYHLGTLYSVVSMPSAGLPEDDPLLDSANALAKAAPSMTAQSLIDAIQAVADQMQRHKLTAQTVKKLADSITTSFGSGPLTALPLPTVSLPPPPPAAK